MLIDTSTIVLTVIFIVAIFGPIAYLIWRGKYRTKKCIKVLKEVEKIYDLKCLASDSWGDKAIGFDAQKGKLIFVDLLSAGTAWKLIDIKRATSCQLTNNGDTIQLLISGGDENGKGMVILPFFNSDVDDPVERGFHAVLANRWLKIVESNLKKTTRSPRRAA